MLVKLLRDIGAGAAAGVAAVTVLPLAAMNCSRQAYTAMA